MKKDNQFYQRRCRRSSASIITRAYSVYSVLDLQGDSLGQGRIDHAHPEDFRALVRRWPGCRVVFEAGMNWPWLFEILGEGTSVMSHK